ncbi:hypothetical protein FGRMN_10906 [Fusarium graminum]|nr:hypothetical protein FGRMN_10906 [Fusarium graminum]
MRQPFSTKTIKRRFKCWIDAKLFQYEDKEKAHIPVYDPDVPHLPNPRPYALTPSSSVQDFEIPPQIPLFFQKLPPEIRYDILALAFGDRTVHMDLFFDHPFGKPKSWQTCKEPEAHGGSQTPYLNYLDRDKPPRWQWRGCVCHRNHAPLFSRYDDRVKGQFEEPGGDGCLTGYSLRCGEHTMIRNKNDPTEFGKWKKRPELCLIGALGWLQACRQAYVEGVHVLYNSNTIHISSKPLLYNISTLMVPHRLSDMSSLEIVWTINTRQHLGKAYPRQDELNQILTILDDSFPHLKRLSLGINVNRDTQAFVDFSDMIKTTDTFVSRRTNHLTKPVEVSITSSAYEEWYETVFTKEYKKIHGWGVGYLYWRYLSGENAHAPHSSIPELWAKVEGATAQNGYWIMRGDKDDDREMERAMNYTVTCFGSAGMNLPA